MPAISLTVRISLGSSFIGFSASIYKWHSQRPNPVLKMKKSEKMFWDTGKRLRTWENDQTQHRRLTGGEHNRSREADFTLLIQRRVLVEVLD
jgi:hypothetical protein